MTQYNKLFIIGSTSFAASYLINLALSKGIQVVGVSRSSEYEDIFLPYAEAKNRGEYQFHQIDIREDLDVIKDALLECFPFTLIIAKGDQSIGLRLKQRMFALHGDISVAPEFAKEYGIYYSLLPDTMHNCGLYLDARPVRKWLANNSKDRRVLNLFSFTGSLGISALKGGAKAAIHLDKSKDLLSRIQKSYKKNDLDMGTRSFIQGDIYKHLPKAIKNKQTFDGIILDPPPKVYKSPYSEHQPKGQDFSKLVSLCSKLLNPGGWLICLFHRYDATWDQSDAEIIESSSNTLKMTER